jgi:hypothetical protein
MYEVKLPTWSDLLFLHKWWLPASAVVVVVWLIFSFGRIEQISQTNTLGPTGDFLAVILASIMVVLFICAGCFGGNFAGCFGVMTFIATLRAMLLMQSPAVFMALLVKLLRWLTPCLGQLSKNLLFGNWPRIFPLDILQVKLASPSKIPYRLYPISCVLLN